MASDADGGYEKEIEEYFTKRGGYYEDGGILVEMTPKQAKALDKTLNKKAYRYQYSWDDTDTGFIDFIEITEESSTVPLEEVLNFFVKQGVRAKDFHTVTEGV